MHVTLKSFYSLQLNWNVSVKADYKTTHPCGSYILRAQLLNSDL